MHSQSNRNRAVEKYAVIFKYSLSFCFACLTAETHFSGFRPQDYAFLLNAVLASCSAVWSLSGKWWVSRKRSCIAWSYVYAQLERTILCCIWEILGSCKLLYIRISCMFFYILVTGLHSKRTFGLWQQNSSQVQSAADATGILHVKETSLLKLLQCFSDVCLFVLVCFLQWDEVIFAWSSSFVSNANHTSYAMKRFKH